MPLQPFTPPLPETRFLHAGRLVYKFKIRYVLVLSVTSSGLHPVTMSLGAPDPDNMDGAAEELEEAIRVILGNLDNLHPFSTEHFTIFPYLSPWERVSKMRFKHKNVHLVPYPYVCTMYLELNAFQPSGSAGEEGNKGHEELVCHGLKVKRSSEVSEGPAVDELVKRRRGEAGAEALCPQLGVDRAGAECVHRRSKVEHGSET
ncbi:PREDICTED: uncharacterized protein C11orf85 homolog, partial [Buceros rhinoceros silvestris]|uniref:uncharacterized protein C11orf85 homolog n=1 Tax=Buceros rhinoceros silvestris TaxID=175836 RepID=UPI000529270A